MLKIFTIVGCRPNFSKVDITLPNQFICNSSQHYDYKMSRIFFKELRIPRPLVNLHCKGNEIGKMIDRFSLLFKKEKPDMVIVVGDTHSALAGALAAAYLNIQVTHIEAGLRSYRNMPEETNRVLIDRIARIKFCPNEEAQLNLQKEGITKDVYVVGDPSLDTLKSFTPIKNTKERGTYILLTLHRNFNADSKEIIEKILNTLSESGEKIIFPIHPRTKQNIERFKIKIPKNIKITSPVSYKKMLELISNAKKVITDSGGIQRESFWMNVPVIILREETEWLEIIRKGGGILVGTDSVKILDAIQNFKGQLNPPPPFGAKEKIKEIIYKYL